MTSLAFERTEEASQLSIVEYLQRGIALLLADIEETEFWRVVTSPDTDPLLVREVMKQVYLEIHWYQPDVIEATTAIIGQFPRSISAKRIRTMLHHQAEEWDHGEMALRDYVGLGGDEAEARASRMSPTAYNTAAFWRMLAHKRDPYAYLGALYLFEGLTPIVTDRVKGNLMNRGVPPSALEYIEFHSTEDIRHTKIVDHLISEMGEADPEAARSMAFGFDAFRQVYPLPGWWAAYMRGTEAFRQAHSAHQELTASRALELGLTAPFGATMSSLAGLEPPQAGCSTRWIARLGLPHLGPGGLSESWFLQHAGDMHWHLLSQHVGAPSDRWIDQLGRRLYASFVAVQLDGPLLASASEGDLLACETDLWVGGANRHVSRHRLWSSRNQQEATLWMVSSFVRREGGTNRGFVRATPRPADEVTAPVPATAVTLMARRRELRLSVMTRPSGGSVVGMRVCASEDYNAMGMVYFANFPRLLDRAERLQRFGADNAFRTILKSPVLRQCFYYGNADGGDELEAQVEDHPRGTHVRLWHRGGSGLLCIANVVRTPDVMEAT